MIRVECHTNLDTWKHVKFPGLLVGVPHVGDKIEALEPACIRVKHNDGTIESVEIANPTLEVCGVTHCARKILGVRLGSSDPLTEPYLRVELHHRYAREYGWLY